LLLELFEQPFRVAEVHPHLWDEGRAPTAPGEHHAVGSGTKGRPRLYLVLGRDLLQGAQNRHLDLERIHVVQHEGPAAWIVERGRPRVLRHVVDQRSMRLEAPDAALETA